MGNYFIHTIMSSFKYLSNGGMSSTMGTANKRKQHFFTWLYNVLSPYASRGSHPYFENNGERGKGNIQDLKISLLRKLFFYLEYSSEISTNNLIWMDHKSVSKFSGCPSLEKNSWQCPRLYSILFKFTDTATKLYKLNNGPTAGLSNFIILVEFISYQCVHYFLHTAAHTIAHSCHMRESVSSISFSGSITIILNWQLDELSVQLHAWWGSGEKHCLPDYTEVKPVWYFRHYWIIHIHTYIHTHTKFMYNVKLQTLKTELLHFSIILWVWHFLFHSVSAS